MAKLDEVKEWLNFLNRLFTIGLVSLLGIVGWLFINYNSTSIVLVTSALIGVLVLVVTLVLLTKRIITNIKMLKDLK